MRLISQRTSIDFMGLRRPAMWVSAVLIAISLASLAFRGLQLGVDFTGGTLIEVSYAQAAPLDEMRALLKQSQFDDASVQRFGADSDALIRIAPREGVDSNEISNRITQLLRDSGHEVQLRRAEFVGPQVGEELVNDGALAVVYALLCILIYVSLRFQFRFSVGAVAALTHDVIITMGFFSISGMEFDLSVLAAVLAVIGYSLNDTIVVYDHIRENFHQMHKSNPEEVINFSLNRVLSRTIITSLTTLLVVVTLFLLGGEIIHGFSAALIVGVLIGTWSSLFVASPILLAMNVTAHHLMPVKKEKPEHGQL
ncbi:MAG: protein translocase subunit SecF [Candidatus Eutrophobiaceae bacterium]